MLNTTANKSELSSSSANSTSVSPFIIILACFSFIATVSNLTLMYLILKRKRPNKLEKISFAYASAVVLLSLAYIATFGRRLIVNCTLMNFTSPPQCLLLQPQLIIYPLADQLISCIAALSSVDCFMTFMPLELLKWFYLWELFSAGQTMSSRLAVSSVICFNVSLLIITVADLGRNRKILSEQVKMVQARRRATVLKHTSILVTLTFFSLTIPQIASFLIYFKPLLGGALSYAWLPAILSNALYPTLRIYKSKELKATAKETFCCKTENLQTTQSASVFNKFTDTTM
ncbi:Lysophosphatidic acid receptor 1-A [Trichinella spiralis]|uniref:Lysophosphatidic acid receptor 1-A n=1 Tax=Trichinella spiralis TaxID=6334 RepID=A0ABR3K2R0_TRISP